LATLDEAQRCPRCNNPGKKIAERPVANSGGHKVIIMECVTEGCVYGPDKNLRLTGERYFFQVRPDGTIPDPEDNPQKAFPKENNAVFGSDDEFEQVRETMRRAQEQMMRPGGGEAG
jgi:hypothetical protein